MRTSMLGIEALPNKTKKLKTMNNNTYNWCKWNKAWVRHDPEGKLDNGCQVIKKLEEEHKPDS